VPVELADVLGGLTDDVQMQLVVGLFAAGSPDRH
jgi:hypothetical protein